MVYQGGVIDRHLYKNTIFGRGAKGYDLQSPNVGIKRQL